MCVLVHINIKINNKGRMFEQRSRLRHTAAGNHNKIHHIERKNTIK